MKKDFNKILTGEKVTKTELAKALNISRPTLDKYIKKPGLFNVDQINKLSKIYNIPENDILTILNVCLDIM